MYNIGWKYLIISSHFQLFHVLYSFLLRNSIENTPQSSSRISRIYPTWTSIFSDSEPLSVWGSVQRSQVWYRGNWLRQPAVQQCPARVGFGQSRSEKWRKNVIHSFREVQVKKNDLRSRSRNESEMKMTENRDREVKVKWKSFEIEIEKWNFSRIFENLKRTDFDLSERVHLEVISFLYVIC